MLANDVAHVIGVDTHKASHTAAIVDRVGGLLASTTIATDAFGHRRLLTWADAHSAQPRVWAVEGTGSYGAGLTTFLLEHGEVVAEIDRPARPARRNGAKSDELDAVRAAREALARPHLAQPRRRGTREAVRVLLRTRAEAVRARSRAITHLKALVVTAPDALRKNLEPLTTDDLLARGARLRTTVGHSAEHRATVVALRSTARRALALEAEAADLESRLEELLQELAPRLLRSRASA